MATSASGSPPQQQPGGRRRRPPGASVAFASPPASMASIEPLPAEPSAPGRRTTSSPGPQQQQSLAAPSAAAAAAAPPPLPARPVGEKLPLLDMPASFAIVEDGVYRSAIPHRRSFTFVQQLQLKTALVLSPEKPLRETLGFFADNNITLIHLGVQSWQPRRQQSWHPVNDELIKEGLEVVLDRTTHPILVMGSSGVHQTGILVGCLRRLQRWCLTAVLYEYHMFAGVRARQVAEQYMELFDVDIVTLPDALPSWWCGPGQASLEHEPGQRAADATGRHAESAGGGASGHPTTADR